MKSRRQGSRGFVFFVGVAKARRLAIKKLLFNSAKFWYSPISLSLPHDVYEYEVSIKKSFDFYMFFFSVSHLSTIPVTFIYSCVSQCL